MNACSVLSFKMSSARNGFARKAQKFFCSNKLSIIGAQRMAPLARVAPSKEPVFLKEVLADLGPVTAMKIVPGE